MQSEFCRGGIARIRPLTSCTASKQFRETRGLEATTGRHRTRRNAGGGDAQVSDEVRMLRAEVQRLEAAQSISLPAPVAAVGHSLSMMKCAQTAAVCAHEDGYSVVADALGLRLTVGRIADGLPPTYVAE
ncbi:hypothetical protein B0H10DRAFT_1959176 [Mycena sp. CBHHK59/15]|nr:hypothetical protein B0H10DRAFT_1959176 [Mycena sp. CBHHK59/15]